MYQQPEREHSYSRERMRRELLQKSYEADKKKIAKKKKSNITKIIIALIFAILISGGVLVKLWLDTDPFFVPGEVYVDDTVDEEYKNIIVENTNKYLETGNKIYSDITYSQKTVLDQSAISENDILVKIELPTVSFYSSELNVTSSEIEDKVKWIDFTEITPETRVVSIDNKYFFDDINAGARYTYLSYETSGDKNTAIWIATADQDYDQKYPMETKDFLSLAQTGVTALTRAMTLTLNNKSKANGRGSYFADKIKDFLSSKDLTHISNEVSFTDGCQGSTGTMSLCADWRSLDSITAIGTDIVELTGNHNNNYGTSANIKTIEKYTSLGMMTFGGGKNEAEASKPLQIEKKGQKITMLGYNHSTSTKGNGELADGDRPGANGYTEAKAKKDISEAKARGDFVIVDIQYSECWSYPDGYTELPRCDYPISGQQSFFRKFIDWGADVVVGTQAHHPQTFEYYKGKPIYYGLGNLFFDQTYWPGTQRGYILTHYFYNNKLLNTRISPTWYDEKHQVYLTNEATSEKFIKRLMEASPKGN